MNRDKFAKSWCKYFKLWKFKGIEFQFDWFTNLADEWFILKFETKSKTNHAGWIFEFALFKLFNFSVHFYDSRHWDYDNNKFKDPIKYLTNYDKAKQSLTELMNSYKDDFEEKFDAKIIVGSEEFKEELIKVADYLSGFTVRSNKGKYVTLDSNIAALNWLMNLNENHTLIKVENKKS